MRNVYLYLKEYNELIIETILASNDQLISYEIINDIIIFKEDVFEEFDYLGLINLLEDDFSFSIILVIGGNLDLVLNYIKFLPYGLYNFSDLIILMIRDRKAKKIKDWLIKIDRELLDTVRIFIESDMSVNKTSKKLYIHRNTLNYRLDKFERLTDLNIRTFKGCMAVYLVLNFVQTAN